MGQNGAEKVMAAGQISVYKGQVKSITNNSGHYKPSVTESMKFPDIFKELGINIQGAILKIYEEGGKLLRKETIK